MDAALYDVSCVGDSGNDFFRLFLIWIDTADGPMPVALRNEGLYGIELCR
ncbi:hypothetical protein [Cognatishimia sp. F0-27]|nr:hypothetical protein [Cognatishimia sp. F0-27]MCC1494698.1 hypothetical protein [Cognatishimia sp. F0-27]